MGERVNKFPQMVIYKYFTKYLEPETSVTKWLFQLDDPKPLYRKWLFHHFHPFKTGWLSGTKSTSISLDKFFLYFLNLIQGPFWGHFP